MKKLYLAFFILLCVVSSNAIITETGSLRDFLYGQDSTFVYDNFVSHISEGIADPGYNYYAPFDPQTSGFGTYVMPSSNQLSTWASLSNYFVTQNWAYAEYVIVVNNLPYQIVEFHDTDYDRTYYMLRETLNYGYFDANLDSDPDDDVTGSFDRGWGLYIFNPQATNPIIVTVPCPKDNFISPVIGYNSFTKWDAAFLMIAGAGREVRWNSSQSYHYYNSLSISDPSRAGSHPFNECYLDFAAYITQEYGRPPFSAQMHSYDWGDRHQGLADTQISAGYNSRNANLPIWDHSNNGQDLLHWSDEIIFPANTFGIHRQVDRNDYYSIFNQNHPLYYNNNPDTPVNTDIGLNCYRDNVQMNYTNEGTNDYDIIDPFFHILIDELPDAYEQTEANYKWFYGYDAVTDKFVKENIYTMTENYYNYWIERIAENIDTFINIENPSPSPEVPDNFRVVAENRYGITLSWDPISDHNFKTYEILYSTEPISNNNYEIYNSNDNDQLADQKTNQVIMYSLSNNTEYFFQLRAVDYSGNSSSTSEISGHLSQYSIPSYYVFKDSNGIGIKWTANSENDIFYFEILKREFGSLEWQVASDSIYADSTIPNTIYDYIWYDEDIQLGDYYEYKLAVYDINGTPYLWDTVLSYHYSEILSLNVLSTTNPDVSTVSFGVNKRATDYYDRYIDSTSSQNGAYLYACFYEKNYHRNMQSLSKNIYGYIDLTQDYIELTLRIKTYYTNQPITISLNEDINTDRYSRKVWLKTPDNIYYDLAVQDCIFTFPDTENHDFTLYYGNMNPTITLGENLLGKIYHPRETLNLQWSSHISHILGNYNLNLISATDSLNITNILNTQVHSFPWTIPATTRIEDAKFVINSIADDGQALRYESKSSIAILPSELTYEFEQGWQLVSHVWEDYAPSANVLFGPENYLVELIEGDIYEPTLSYSFGKGYWVHIPEAIESTNSGDIYNDQVNTVIHPGWNLLGNPYPTEISLSSLTFNVGNTALTLSDMITYNYISRGIYTHGENGYELSNKVSGMGGFLLYSNIGEYSDVSLTYAPYGPYIALDLLPLNWTSQIIAEANGDKDNIVLGISDYATDYADQNLDFRKAPHKPYEGVDIYLNYHSPNELLYPNKQQDIKAYVGEDEVKEWSFLVNARSLDPVTLSFNSSDFPNGSLYTALEFNGNNFPFDPEHDFEFTPFEVGEYQFKLKVANYPLDNEEGEVAPLAAYFNVYPNPFNPETTIAFTLKQAGKVELAVYNLKGQKVKTLCNDVLSAGNKTFVWKGKNNQGKQTASGIYFIKMNAAGQKSQIRKIMLMK